MRDCDVMQSVRVTSKYEAALTAPLESSLSVGMNPSTPSYPGINNRRAHPQNRKETTPVTPIWDEDDAALC